MKWLIVFLVLKGLTTGTVVLAVVHSGLSPFLQALIIATVSSLIGAAGMMMAAYITIQSTRKKQDEIDQHVRDVKQALGADRRSEDK